MRRRERQPGPVPPSVSGAIRELEPSQHFGEEPPNQRSVPPEELIEPTQRPTENIGGRSSQTSIDEAIGTGRRVDIAGVDFDHVSEKEAIWHVLSELDQGRGGRIVTPNVDILRNLWEDPQVRRLVADAELIVADGVPLLWLARWTRNVKMSRVTGSDLIFSLSEAAAAADRSIFIIGGPPGAAERAAENLAARYPGLRVAGSCCPAIGFDEQEQSLDEVVAEVVRASPDIVFCGLGFPKQERLAEAVRPHLPGTWFVGCGAAVLFASGDQRRAPRWMQRSGFEWVYRMAKEPRRLFKRYVIRDIPFLTRVLIPHYLPRPQLSAEQRPRAGARQAE